MTWYDEQRKEEKNDYANANRIQKALSGQICPPRNIIVKNLRRRREKENDKQTE